MFERRFGGSPWAVGGMLYALDALTLTELWDSKQVTARDDLGSFAKFVSPVVANGKVYMATHSQEVCVYGLLPGQDHP